MKQASQLDLQLMNNKIDLLNYKLDRLMEAQGVVFQRPKQEVDKGEGRQQANTVRKGHRKSGKQLAEDYLLRMDFGPALQYQFDLKTLPPADIIRDYQRTQNPSEFDGLKRKDG